MLQRISTSKNRRAKPICHVNVIKLEKRNQVASFESALKMLEVDITAMFEAWWRNKCDLLGVRDNLYLPQSQKNLTRLCVSVRNFLDRTSTMSNSSDLPKTVVLAFCPRRYRVRRHGRRNSALTDIAYDKSTRGAYLPCT